LSKRTCDHGVPDADPCCRTLAQHVTEATDVASAVLDGTDPSCFQLRSVLLWAWIGSLL
jgi:hypothetical protein